MSGVVRIGSHVFRSFLISKSFYKDIGWFALFNKGFASVYSESIIFVAKYSQ